MIGTKICVKIIVCLSLFLQSTKANYQLELVQVVFRHGDRTPSKMELFPRAPYNPIYDKLGYGQLTEEGKKREYHLGTLLRERYNKFLGNTYKYGDVRGISTDFQRTKMSLQLVLNGLYSDISNQMNWPSVPISYLPLIVDTVMFPILCPSYQDELRKVKDSVVFRLLVLKYKELFKYLETHTGYDMSSEAMLRTCGVYQYLSSQKSMNIALPSWATAYIQKKIEEIVEIDYSVQSYTPKLKRLFGGMLVKKMIENMNFKGNSSTPKMYLYSGHEINVASFAKAHGLNEPKIPLYGSAIIVEKLRNNFGQQFVQMFLWTGVTENLITYTLPTCTTVCPYDRYIKLTNYIIPTDDESECMWEKVTKDQLHQYFDSYPS